MKVASGYLAGAGVVSFLHSSGWKTIPDDPAVIYVSLALIAVAVLISIFAIIRG